MRALMHGIRGDLIAVEIAKAYKSGDDTVNVITITNEKLTIRTADPHFVIDQLFENGACNLTKAEIVSGWIC